MLVSHCSFLSLVQHGVAHEFALFLLDLPYQTFAFFDQLVFSHYWQVVRLFAFLEFLVCWILRDQNRFQTLWISERGYWLVCVVSLHFHDSDLFLESDARKFVLFFSRETFFREKFSFCTIACPVSLEVSIKKLIIEKSHHIFEELMVLWECELVGVFGIF